ncbi:thioredoxin-like 4, chloroplastic [Zingiber officinale]|uniref:thioredoxin-like 4, chloroplastic n=1 Tax=Zingiber officinale TaxID=94328 RepID=UPI001C4CDE16|nr:thioredoxin-like 4, chloroplastic [Zingiber officinale]
MSSCSFFPVSRLSRRPRSSLDCFFMIPKSPIGRQDSILVRARAAQIRFRHSHEQSLVLKQRNNLPLNVVTDSQIGSGGGEAEEEEEDVCPVDCVREFKTEDEFSRIMERAKAAGALVVVDFYRTSCGSCKYIEQGFAKLCKCAGDRQAEPEVVFLKHNVIDEYDEQSEVAERLRIRAVPLFHFYKNGVLLEAFPTRDKERIVAAILKYTSSA